MSAGKGARGTGRDAARRDGSLRAEVPDRDEAEPRRPPRYHDIAAELQGKIADGTYPVGQNLPTEAVLCRTFGVSRHTVREALKRLASRGLVERRRAVGTLVRARYPEGRYRQPLPGPATLVEIPRDLAAEIVERGTVQADLALARQLGCAEGRAWAWFGILRRSPEGPPVSWTDLYVCPTQLEPEGGRSLSGATPALEARCLERAETIDVTLDACRLSARQAEHLAVDPETAALLTVRRLQAGGSLFCVSLSRCPSGRFGYEVRLARAWQPARERPQAR